jgi:uncharacterized cupredoxin-like copper-binding protein
LHHIRLTAVGVSAAALVAGLLVAFLATDGTAARTSPQILPKPVTVNVKAGDFFFNLKRVGAGTLAVRKGTKVTFVVKNVGATVHDFAFSSLSKKTRYVQPGGTARLVITFTKKGRFPFLCTVPRHAERGMAGSFLVKA